MGILTQMFDGDMSLSKFYSSYDGVNLGLLNRKDIRFVIYMILACKMLYEFERKAWPSGIIPLFQGLCWNVML